MRTFEQQSYLRQIIQKVQNITDVSTKHKVQHFTFHTLWVIWQRQLCFSKASWNIKFLFNIGYMICKQIYYYISNNWVLSSRLLLILYLYFKSAWDSNLFVQHFSSYITSLDVATDFYLWSYFDEKHYFL